MAFHVGQLVVCIHDIGPWLQVETGGEGCGPAKGEVCRVSDVYKACGIDCLSFEEYGSHRGYDAWSFRPAQHSGMSILRRIAARPDLQIREPA